MGSVSSSATRRWAADPLTLLLVAALAGAAVLMAAGLAGRSAVPTGGGADLPGAAVPILVRSPLVPAIAAALTAGLALSGST